MLATYLILRLLLFPFSLLPYKALHALGRPLGSLAYYFIPSYRKRALANIALALPFTNPKIRHLAKASLATLVTTCLEYPKLARQTDLSKVAVCENPEEADKLMSQGNGVIFFCGHQSNWELLFLEGTSRMAGVAIGRPTKNPHLYRFVKKMREQFGGKIIPPKEAIKRGLKALKEGKFLGIVGDQGMPDSGYSSPFMGRLAWTSPMPALLSYKTGAPLLVATTRYENGKYQIHYSTPLFPDRTAPKEVEVKRLMDGALSLFEKSVQKRPHEWLWVHNRWKQQTLDQIKRPYRQDSLAVFLSGGPKQVEEAQKIRTLYPTETLFFFVPEGTKAPLDGEIYTYKDPEEILREDYRFKLLIDFTNDPKIWLHYKKWAAVSYIAPKDFEELKTIVKNA